MYLRLRITRILFVIRVRRKPQGTWSLHLRRQTTKTTNSHRSPSFAWTARPCIRLATKATRFPRALTRSMTACTRRTASSFVSHRPEKWTSKTARNSSRKYRRKIQNTIRCTVTEIAGLWSNRSRMSWRRSRSSRSMAETQSSVLTISMARTRTFLMRMIYPGSRSLNWIRSAKRTITISISWINNSCRRIVPTTRETRSFKKQSVALSLSHQAFSIRVPSSVCLIPQLRELGKGMQTARYRTLRTKWRTRSSIPNSSRISFLKSILRRRTNRASRKAAS